MWKNANDGDEERDVGDRQCDAMCRKKIFIVH